MEEKKLPKLPPQKPENKLNLDAKNHDIVSKKIEKELPVKTPPPLPPKNANLEQPKKIESITQPPKKPISSLNQPPKKPEILNQPPKKPEKVEVVNVEKENKIEKKQPVKLPPQKPVVENKQNEKNVLKSDNKKIDLIDNQIKKEENKKEKPAKEKPAKEKPVKEKPVKEKKEKPIKEKKIKDKKEWTFENKMKLIKYLILIGICALIVLISVLIIVIEPKEKVEVITKFINN